MIIGIISDTHDRLEAMEAALHTLLTEGARLIIHAGDWTKPETVRRLVELCQREGVELKGVLGNNDLSNRDALIAASAGALEPDPLLELEVGGLRIAVHHGHIPSLMKRLEAEPACALVIRGHSHKPLVAERPGGLLVNPGSTAFSIPRSRTFCPTVAVYDTETKQAKILPVDKPRDSVA